MSAERVKRHVEVHRNHSGYYFLASVGHNGDSTQEAHLRDLLAGEYLQTLDAVIDGLGPERSRLVAESWESWRAVEFSCVYARRHVHDLGRKPHPLVRFACAYPYPGLTEIAAHFSERAL